MNTELAIRKAELQAEQNRQLINSAMDLLKNPVFEIITGYLIIEWAQHQVIAETTTPAIPPEKGLQWDWKTGFLGNLWDKGTPATTEKHYLISDKAGTVAEGGLLVAVALQQGGMDLLKSIVSSAGQASTQVIGLAGKALPALLALK